ncbi:hypothetical protein JCM3774_003037, partial [Rhodotorula dairenensis]
MTVHSATSPTGAVSPSSGLARRRLSNRRLRPEGEGQSSREASAESNDETSSPSLLEDDDDDDDDVSLSAPRTRRTTIPAPANVAGAPPVPAAAMGQQFDDLHLGDVTPHQNPATATTTATATASRQQPEPLTEGYDSAHDGDVSSATAGSLSVSAARLATHPHAFRAPVSLHPSSLSHPHPNPHSHPHNLAQHDAAGAHSSVSSSSRQQQQQQQQQQQHSLRSSADDEAEDEEDDEEDDEGGYSPSPPSQTETETDGEPLLSSTAGTVRSKPMAAVPSSYPERRPAQSEPVMWAPAPSGFLSSMTAQDIQEHIRRAIAGDPGRPYKIKPPPTDRPVRIYADGVYDLLHYGHMLQLRQCKLMFPSVHLLVGVCSSALVEQHKSHPVFSSEERYESMRHIRWVDEVVEDAPWQVDQDFIDKWQIDYVAHDEEPYASAGKEDVYAYAKSIGSFLPTKRTNGISTSELLQR